MVGVASSVILCAMVLYAADLRDRCRQDLIEHGEQQHQRSRELDSHKQLETIAANSSSRSGGYWMEDKSSSPRSLPIRDIGLHRHCIHPQFLYHHHQQRQDHGHHRYGAALDGDDEGDIMDWHSISRVSTMTASLAEGGLRLDELSSGMSMMEVRPTKRFSSNVTELSDAHRVPLDTDLSSLIDLSTIPVTTMSDSVMDDADDDYDFDLELDREPDDDHNHKYKHNNGVEARDELEDGLSGMETPEESITTFDHEDDEGEDCDDDDDAAGISTVSPMEQEQAGEEEEEEGESGWSTIDGNSDDSSEVSIGTFLTRNLSTAGSKDSSSSSVVTPQLFGEQCLDATPQKEEQQKDETSFDLSPDLSCEEEEDEVNAVTSDHNELAQLEQLYKSSMTVQESSDAQGEGRTLDQEIKPFAKLIQQEPKEGEEDWSQHIILDKEFHQDEEEVMAQEQRHQPTESKEDLSQDIVVEKKLSQEVDDGVAKEQQLEPRKVEKDFTQGHVVEGELRQEEDNSARKQQQEPHETEAELSQDYVRDIYFVPLTTNPSQANLGIALNDASLPSSHPVVSAVDDSSPLSGRVFVGDVVLAVNDLETVGLCGAQVTSSFSECGSVHDDESSTASKVVKLTVLSMLSDGYDSDSSEMNSDQSIDTGIANSASEV